MSKSSAQAYRMRRFTIIAPHVTNDGAMSDYPAALRDALLDEGYDSWTETETHGAWRGKREAGVQFDILLSASTAPEIIAGWLGAIARRVMPDQEAIQVTIEPGIVLVREG